MTQLAQAGIAFAIGIFVHELSHALVAWLVSFRILQLNLGVIRFRALSPHVRFVPSFDFGVGAVPRDPSLDVHDLIRREALITSAGPMSNLLLGVAFLAAAPGLGGVASLPGAIATMNLILGLWNVLPLTSRRVASDGTRVLTLLSGGPDAVRVVVSGALVALAAGGVRPRDWDAVLLDALADATDDRIARLALYEVAMDRGDIVAAGEHVDALLRSCAASDEPDPIAHNEAAYYVARHRGDARRGRELLALARGSAVLPWMRARAEAAVLLAEGRSREAREVAARGVAALARARRPDAALEREQLDEIMALAAAAP